VHDTKKRLLSWTELHENPVMLTKSDQVLHRLSPVLQTISLKNYYCNPMQCLRENRYG
jgi:hypothetical protein